MHGFALPILTLVLAGGAINILSQEPPASRPQLALSLQVSHARLHGLPRTITVRLQNITQHDVLLPMPHKDCGDGMYGSLFFRIVIQRKSGPVMGVGCTACYTSSGLHVEDRIKSWKRLAPGQALVFAENIPSQTNSMQEGEDSSGTYSFAASYSPPAVSAQDSNLLHAARIYFPQQELDTRWLTYVR